MWTEFRVLCEQTIRRLSTSQTPKCVQLGAPCWVWRTPTLTYWPFSFCGGSRGPGFNASGSPCSSVSSHLGCFLHSPILPRFSTRSYTLVPTGAFPSSTILALRGEQEDVFSHQQHRNKYRPRTHKQGRAINSVLNAAQDEAMLLPPEAEDEPCQLKSTTLELI